MQFRLAPQLVEGGPPEPTELLLRDVAAAGGGLTVRVTKPPSGPLRELDAYTQKVIRARRRGAVYPYELVPMLARNPDPGGVRRHVHRVRPRRERRAGAGASARTGATPPTSCWAPSAPRRPATRRACGAWCCSATRPGRWARSPSPSAAGCCAALELARELSAPDRVVRGVGGREDRDGLRHREHGLDLARAARHHRVHPGGRRDQRRRDRHQRRAPSPTGTPRRRCSCTPRASW